jgi:EAL domain-containing protein (putative c-di-GMP-specific phosphodiesterase class I)
LEFIPLAEEDGLIGEIGSWVLEEACRQLGVWQRQGWARQDLRIAVNVSAAEIGPDLVDRVRSSLARHGLSPERLVVEVTESVFIDERQAAAPLQALRELGVHVAVDDFGTGYSSLSYLHRLPIDILKIDRAFVTGIAEPTNLAVARAVVELGNSLGLSTVAEGIEEPEQVERLRKIGCEQGQGYLWSPPVPAAELPTICRRIDAVGRASRERQQVS